MGYTIFDGKGTRAVILPEKGATVVSLTHWGEEFLYYNDENIHSDERPRCGIPFIFPSFGRLKNGEYVCSGKNYSMGLHGFAHTSTWETAAHSGDRLRLLLTDNADTMAQFPFRFRVELDFRVSDGQLSIAQTYTNSDEKTMPYNYGFHPYFAIGTLGDATVQLKANSCFLPGEGKHIPYAGEPLSAKTSPGQKELSLILQGAVSPAVLSVPAMNRKITLHFDGSYQNLVLWRPSDSGFLCVEPIQGMPNGLNTGVYKVLQPGQSHCAEVRICV